MTHIALLGNPNCGKTTLFNALTGETQRIGNWPGVTVEQRTGCFMTKAQSVYVTDLPGVYTLVSSETMSAQDEQITAKYVAQGEADVIVNVVDACHLERHLYLTSQLLELGRPMVVALTMTDLAHRSGIMIDCDALSEQLGCAVISVQAHRQDGVEALKKAVGAVRQRTACPLTLACSTEIQAALRSLEARLRTEGVSSTLAFYYAHRLLEGDTLLMKNAAEFVSAGSSEWDVVLADARYQAVHEIVLCVQRKTSDASEHWTARIDRVVLHRVWALPVFLGVMYAMFFFAIHIGAVFQPCVDLLTDALFVQGSAQVLAQWHSPAWMIALLSYGVGKGLNTTLTFIPVIAAMFFFLSCLEASGYMARAAFVVDKFMRMLGLPGKSFVPMIVGFGCNVPAIMAARTLDSERDRLLTILMSPFMSCSARLAIYSVFVAAFFPHGGQNIVFSLYLTGILMAVFTGFIVRKTMLQGQASPLILELPAYHKPALRRVFRDMLRRLRYFVTRAGQLIIPVCVLLGGLNALTIHGGISGAEAGQDSVLALIGQILTPFFAPMGITQDNWPATVGLLSGMLAKEVVVGSLNTLYSQMSTLTHTAVAFDVWGACLDALRTVPEQITRLGQAVIHPMTAGMPDAGLSQAVYGVMYRRFDGKIGAYAYLLFILLYIPCVSTMAVIRQEASRKLMWFSILWSFTIAYAGAVLFYQAATIYRHPQQTLFWAGCMVFLIMTSIRLNATQGARYVTANS